MHREPSVTELLGVEARLVERHVLPPGAPEGAVAPTLAALLAAAGLSYAFTDRAELPVYRTERAPGLVAVAPEALGAVVCGTRLEAEGMVAFDTRRERVLVRLLDDAGREFALHAQGGALELYELAAVDPLADLDPPAEPLPLLPAPDVVAWSREVGAEPWLAAAAAELAEAPGDVERAAAAGLLARLWEPGGTASPPPRERVRSWALALGEAELDRLEVQAQRRAHALVERLEGDEELGAHAGAALVLERDDLQSVRRVLRLAGRGGELSAALAEVDALARAQATRLAGALPALDADPHADRWLAVAGQEPDAWWSGLG